MFYNRVQLKKSALSLLKSKWDKAVVIGFFVTLPFYLFYTLFILWTYKLSQNYDNAAAEVVNPMIFKSIPFFLAFVFVCVIFLLALCRWSIQLAKSGEKNNPDAPPPPGIKDFFKFFTPMAIPLYFWIFLRMFLWFLLMYATIIPLGAVAWLIETKPILAVILMIICIFIYFFVYLLILAKSTSYAMAFYAYADNSDLKITKTTKIAVKITDGFRTNLYVTGLSFIGWFMLGMITFGIALFWIIPYCSQVFANAWLFMKNEKSLLIEEK